ncbi:MAG: AAA family ATPase [Actinomycetota bacterium]|nr:AAA family ATPase [Actinomycetota bacterium]
MFIDIVGSMDVAERVGDEGWRDIIDRFFAATSGSILGLGGTVHQFTGDGVMALFGAPLAQEDHARRACLAALHVHDCLAPLAAGLASEGVELAVRVGLHSGEVIVGTIGDEVQMDWAAIGHTTGVAKRMESLAAPGSTTVSTATAMLIAGEFDLTPLGSVPVKGISESQEVFELCGRTAGVQGRLDAGRRRGTLSTLVGRDHEQRILTAALESASTGAGEAVILIGDPGMGKSRLVVDVADRCTREGVSMHRVVAEPHGQLLPLQPVLTLLRSVFGVDSRDEPAAARARIQAVLEGLEASFSEDLPLIFDLLGTQDPARPSPTMDPESRQRHLLEFIARLVRALGRTDPVVIACEDLHWFDEASRSYFAEVVRAAAGTRTLVLGTTRTEYQADELEGDHVRRLVLNPLEPSALRALLREILGAASSLDGLAELITERAAGNPFFCEELVVALSETGHLNGQPGSYQLAQTIESLVLPPTVQATLAARLDRLGSEEKQLVQDAAVIGTEFTAGLVAEVAEKSLEDVGRTLQTLVAADMITAADDGGHARYAFRHPLTREVAYHSQLSPRRRARHARLAEAIARLHADNLDEQSALLAHHSEEAGLTMRAAHWQTRAARWAERTSPQMGMTHWETARRLADRARDAAGPGGSGTDLALLGVEARVGILNQSWRVGLALDAVLAIHQEALQLHGGVHSMPPRLRLFLDWGLYASLLFTGHEQEAYPIAMRNLELAAQIDEGPLTVTTAAGSAYGAFVVGRLDEAIAIADHGLAVADGDVTLGGGILMANPYAHCLLIRAICTCLLGDVPTASRELSSALTIAQTHDAPEMATYAHWGLALVCIASRDAPAAQEHAHAALELAGQAGNAWGQTMAQQAVAWGHLGMGDLAAAEQACHAGLNLIKVSGIGHHYEPVLRTALAQAMLGSGRTDAALEQAAAASGSAELRGLSWAELPARLALGLVLLSAGWTEEATVALKRARALADETGIRLYDGALRSAERGCLPAAKI